MGLFSNLRGAAASRNVSDDLARSVLTMPLLVATADGRIDQAELDQLLNMCAYSPVFHAVGAERTMELAKEILALAKSKGGAAAFQAARPHLSVQMAETALCFAIRTALADGSLDESEKKMLIQMGEGLGVAPETFVKIFDVIAMLQRRAA
ncbi:MAG: tellurite resistance TerB family protein [Paracoccaceae bacterium]